MWGGGGGCGGWVMGGGGGGVAGRCWGCKTNLKIVLPHCDVKYG